MSQVLAGDADARSGRREQRKAENRAKLLVAARRVFAAKGLGAATVRDIVRETDLATGTFYNYFEDKDEIFHALLEEFSEKARARVRAARAEPGTIEARIERAYRAYFEIAIEEEDLFQVLRRNAGTIATTAPDLFESGVAELFADMREWAAAGDLPELDFDYLATAGVAIGTEIARHMLEREPPDPGGAARFCTRLFMGGIDALARE